MTFVIGTAGHVDHGKSTLVKALTGIDPDRLAEEKAREMTIDLGFAWLTLPSGQTVGIVDVPGHRDFIENMLAGVGGIDLAVLVIAADEGIMPQTREHLAIIDLLQIPAGVVALTKIDLVTEPDWLQLVIEEITKTLVGTVMEGCPVVPVSARTGSGLTDLIEALDTALAYIPHRLDLGRPRLPVDRVFTISGFGTVVTGTLSGGSLASGEEIEILPSGKRARIRGVQSHKTTADRAYPGSRVALNLTGISKDEIKRGEVIVQPGLLHPTTLFDAQFRQVADASRPLLHNSEVKLFTGSSEAVATVRLLGDQELKPGQEGWLQLRVNTPVAVDRGDRFILRIPSPGETIGGGVILDAHPPHRWRRFKPEVIEQMKALATDTPESLILHHLAGNLALPISKINELYSGSSEDLARILDNLRTQGLILNINDHEIMSRQRWETLLRQVETELRDYHSQNPLKAGMPKEMLRSRLDIESKLFNTLLERIAETGLILYHGSLVRLQNHTIRFTDQQVQLIASLMNVMKQSPYNTPSVKDAQNMVGNDVFFALLESGEIQLVSDDVVFDAKSYAQARDKVASYINQNGSITVAQARDLFGTSRKYALALLEHLDSTGFTRRNGDERTLN